MDHFSFIARQHTADPIAYPCLLNRKGGSRSVLVGQTLVRSVTRVLVLMAVMATSLTGAFPATLPNGAVQVTIDNSETVLFSGERLTGRIVAEQNGMDYILPGFNFIQGKETSGFTGVHDVRFSTGPDGQPELSGILAVLPGSGILVTPLTHATLPIKAGERLILQDSTGSYVLVDIDTASARVVRFHYILATLVMRTSIPSVSTSHAPSHSINSVAPKKTIVLQGGHKKPSHSAKPVAPARHHSPAPPGPRFAGRYYRMDGPLGPLEKWDFFKDGTWTHTGVGGNGIAYGRNFDRGTYALRGNILELIATRSITVAGAPNVSIAGKNRPAPMVKLRFKNLGARGIELNGKLYNIRHWE